MCPQSAMGQPKAVARPGDIMTANHLRREARVAALAFSVAKP